MRDQAAWGLVRHRRAAGGRRRWPGKEAPGKETPSVVRQNPVGCPSPGFFCSWQGLLNPCPLLVPMPLTQGKAMGWGFIALGFGLSFGVVIMMFNYISAHLNPATIMALWVLGKVSL